MISISHGGAIFRFVESINEVERDRMPASLLDVGGPSETRRFTDVYVHVHHGCAAVGPIRVHSGLDELTEFLCLDGGRFVVAIQQAAHEVDPQGLRIVQTVELLTPHRGVFNFDGGFVVFGHIEAIGCERGAVKWRTETDDSINDYDVEGHVMTLKLDSGEELRIDLRTGSRGGR